MGMVRRFVLASASVIALTSAASAADIYRAPEGVSYKDTPYVAVSWSGFYAGVSGGYAWTGKKATVSTYAKDDIEANGYGSDLSKFTHDGGFGGGQIGYNWQQDRLVYGIEADIQGSNAHGGSTAAVQTDCDARCGLTSSATGSTSLDWFGTVRARLGLAVADRGLVYATGGFAYGGVKDRLSLTTDDSVELGVSDVQHFTSNREDIKTGYVLGAGFEYFILPAWSLKAEYQYLNLGDSARRIDLSYSTGNKELPTAAVPGPETHSFGAGLSSDHSYNTVRLGLNYHIGYTYEPLK